MEIKEQNDLIRAILQTKMDLVCANKNFELAEGEMIDYYAYQIKAYKAKMDYLIRKVKDKSIIIDPISNIDKETDLDNYEPQENFLLYRKNQLLS